MAEGGDFSTLVRTIEDRLEDIDDSTYDQPALFIQNLLKRSGDQYSALFEIMRDMCEDASEDLSEIQFSEDESEEEARYRVFNILQGIERDYAQIAELPFRHELYYFVEDVLQDLEIDSDIVVIPGNSAEVFVNRSSERYGPAIKGNVKFYSDVDKNHRIIEYQRTELKNPESYPLLIHELFHVFIDEKEDGKHITQALRSIKSQLEPKYYEYTEEILVDLLSINYTGPIYAHTISKMPEKVGSHSDLVHPENSERERYLLDYLEYIEERKANLPIKGVDIISTVRDNIGEPGSERILSDFEAIQSRIESMLEDFEASTYQEIHNNIKLELGMPDAPDKQVAKMLKELFLYTSDSVDADRAASTGGKDDADLELRRSNVAVPIRPVFLLNLLLIDDREASKLYRTYLAAFKKWYVRKQTSIVRDKNLDQTPEVKSHNHKDISQF